MNFTGWSAPIPLRVAVLQENQTSGTDAGTFTGGARRVRVLNTISDPFGIVSLSSNQFILQAGVYAISWNAPASQIDSHKSFLRDVTNSVDAGIGSSQISDAAVNEVTQSSSDGYAVVSISSATTYQIEHLSAGTKATLGLGRAGALGTEVYTRVKIEKLR